MENQLRGGVRPEAALGDRAAANFPRHLARRPRRGAGRPGGRSASLGGRPSAGHAPGRPGARTASAPASPSAPTPPRYLGPRDGRRPPARFGASPPPRAPTLCSKGRHSLHTPRPPAPPSSPRSAATAPSPKLPGWGGMLGRRARCCGRAGRNQRRETNEPNRGKRRARRVCAKPQHLGASRPKARGGRAALPSRDPSRTRAPSPQRPRAALRSRDEASAPPRAAWGFLSVCLVYIRAHRQAALGRSHRGPFAPRARAVSRAAGGRRALAVLGGASPSPPPVLRAGTLPAPGTGWAPPLSLAAGRSAAPRPPRGPGEWSYLLIYGPDVRSPAEARRGGGGGAGGRRGCGAPSRVSRGASRAGGGGTRRERWRTRTSAIGFGRNPPGRAGGDGPPPCDSKGTEHAPSGCQR